MKENITKKFDNGFAHNKCFAGCNSCDGVLCPDALEIIERAGELEELIKEKKLVEVVFCKDCEYFETKGTSHQGICTCGDKETNYEAEFYPFETDFCSYGRRKTE